jgi:transcriptional regulator GlxA family with amidase domain
VAAIRQAARRIQEDLEDPVSFGQLARELQLSKPALSRRFTRTIGVSYRRLVNDARITRARELLRSSRYTMTEIAQIVGFGDLPRFDKVFKAVVGASPSTYRQQETSERNKLLADRTGS